MKRFPGPNTTPELRSFDSNERREIWQRFYRRSLASARGVLSIIAYGACVFCGMATAEYLSWPRWVGLVAGNLLGSIVCHTGLAAYTRQKISESFFRQDEK